jgi:ABC-type bacteriocin/lantibiotic exporter with double-glycine peptidase domain
MWQARIAAKFLIGFSGIAVLGFGVKTVSPGYMILGVLIVFASVPLLARRR